MLIYTYKEQVCIKKDHEKFKILDILAVTIQAREGIETCDRLPESLPAFVTIQAREGIETPVCPKFPESHSSNNSSPRGH